MESNKKNKKVFVALSGGVDSAVSAALLKEEGYEVTGVYMKNWSGDEYGIQADCPWEKDQKDAENICNHLDIEFRSFNFEKEYRDRVVEYFFAEYEKGRTPNPDVMCNKEVKFKLFLEKALTAGADYIATGHYAQHILSKNNTHKMLKGVDSNKDQTYFLYNITQEQLAYTFFPIGGIEKPRVRELAKIYNLPNADKPDSQGICFIGEINVLKFLMSRIPKRVGEIRDIDTNKKVGEHIGVYFYTLGQREGLGIGGLKEPYFVVDKDINENIIYVGQGTTHKALYKKEVELENIHFIDNREVTNKLTIENIQASVRYRQRPQEGRLEIKNLNSQHSIKFIFNEPQRAVTSGQSLVIYDNDECLGGGVIK